MRARSISPLLLGLLWACPSAEVRVDAAIEADGGAGLADARAASADAALNTDAAPHTDAAPGADAAPDQDALAAPDVASPAGDAGPVPCDSPLTLEGFAEGPIFGGQAVPVRLLPVSAAPVDVAPIVEAGTFVAGVLARVGAAGAPWHTQVSHLTQFDLIHVEHSVRDPSDGATYVGIAQQVQRDGTALRVYHGDGTLAAEFTLAGPAGRDLVGGPRQSNLFVAKIEATGHVAWVSRFGPNRNTNTAGFFNALGLTPRGVRVVGSVEGATEIVFAPGTASAHTLSLRTSGGYWAELDKADGGYLAGSGGGVIAQDAQGGLTMYAYGEHATSPAGETAFAGALSRGASQAVYHFGETSPLVVTATTGYAFIGKIGADGAVPFVGLVEVVGLRSGPEPRAVAISPAGEVVAGGQFSVSGTRAVFRSGRSAATLEYEASNSFVAALTPQGDVRWVQRLASAGRNAVSRLLVSADAVYLSGAMAMGDRIGAGAPGELVVPTGGYVLAKLDLATGEPRWVRVFHEGNSALGSTRHSMSGGRLVWPAAFSAITVSGDGADHRFVAPHPPAPVLGALVLDTDGHLLECQAVAEYVARFTAFP